MLRIRLMKKLLLTLLATFISTSLFSEEMVLHQNTKGFFYNRAFIPAVLVNKLSNSYTNDPTGAWIKCENDNTCKFGFCLEMKRETKWEYSRKSVYGSKHGSYTNVSRLREWSVCSRWSKDFPLATEKDITLIKLEVEKIVESFRKTDDQNILDAQEVVSNNAKVLENLISNATKQTEEEEEKK